MAASGTLQQYMEIDTNLIRTLLNNDFTTQFLEVTKDYMTATSEEVKKENWYIMVDYIMGQIRVKDSVSYETLYGSLGVPSTQWTYEENRITSFGTTYIWPPEDTGRASGANFFAMYKIYTKRVTNSDGTREWIHACPVFNLKLRDTGGNVFFDSAREPSWYAHSIGDYVQWTNYKWRFHNESEDGVGDINKGTTLNQEYGRYIDITDSSNANVQKFIDSENWKLATNGYQYEYTGDVDTSNLTTTTGPYLKRNEWIKDINKNWIKVTKGVTLTDSQGNEIVYNLGKPFPAEPQTSGDIAAMFNNTSVTEHTVGSTSFEVVGGYSESTDATDAFGAAQQSGELGTVQIGEDISRVNNDIISFVFKRGSGDDQLGYIKASVARKESYTSSLSILYTSEEPEPEPQ